MKKFEVTIYNMNNPAETNEVEVLAESQDKAEEMALSGGLVNLSSGWGVMSSKEVKMQPKAISNVEELCAMVGEKDPDMAQMKIESILNYLVYVGVIDGHGWDAGQLDWVFSDEQSN